MDVACLCIRLELSLSQKERDVLPNPMPQLLKLSDLSHCAHYVDHSKQLMLIGHDLSMPTITLMERDFSIVRHPTEIRLILGMMVLELGGISRTTMSAATRRDHQSTTQLWAS